jgi:hypothetical protein
LETAPYFENPPETTNLMVVNKSEGKSRGRELEPGEAERESTFLILNYFDLSALLVSLWGFALVMLLFQLSKNVPKPEKTPWVNFGCQGNCLDLHQLSLIPEGNP